MLQSGARWAIVSAAFTQEEMVVGRQVWETAPGFQKNHPRVEAFGTVDELNSVISYLLTYRLPTPIRHYLKEVQHALSTWADSLAYPGTPSCGHSRLPNSKSFLDRLNQDLEPLRGDDDPGLPLAVQYLNSLSDLLFVMARTLNRAEGRPDILWQRHRHG